jgi:hypothetical protein
MIAHELAQPQDTPNMFARPVLDTMSKELDECHPALATSVFLRMR